VTSVTKDVKNPCPENYKIVFRNIKEGLEK
jgi:hypothetical protein